ncbi:MAG TPA: aspartate--tRNA(Asn) ligase [Candidatus Pacearchaeota archaeon]|nr:aspartate--tRNA(Asn) ligase [Candidatus Pacearchaeota archaeon]HOS12517.1 aspartate--tRNA(Asn) ligase [Candidatus Pacearchaeota archaeon]HPL72544.1 aspartate--tRNA(Asn) ligase [Candidatus Pacearchaeota archaeon]
MERLLIKEISNHEGEKITIKGRIFNIRNLGSISFLIIRDYSGVVQVVASKDAEVNSGDIVLVEGIVKKDERAKGGYEMKAEKIEIITKSKETLPFDLEKDDINLNLNTLLDYRVLSLRHPKVQSIFRLYDLLLKSYDEAMREEGFVEIKTPKILGSASEGGANFFQVDYFDKKAVLAQSPQFYKQIMVGVFDRVFEIGPVFRAEPHFTTRHVNEYISLDAEMGYIDNFYDVAKTLNRVIKKMFFQMGIEDVPEEIPYIKLSEIRKIIKEKYNYDIPEETDIDPRGEELAGQYAKEEFNSDFIFLTHYPIDYRPFYTMSDGKEAMGFDLLYKGLEIATGGQRINEYDELIESMKRKNVGIKGMEFYVNAFKYAIPPHGGWGMGSERIIKQMLGLDNIKEAVLFPRDVKRITP